MRGKPILLPADLFPGCVSVATDEIAAFDAGFDRNASTKTGAITGIDPAGLAHAAGLRDGMRRLGRTGGEEGDSRVPITYSVEDGGAERTITYKPEGKGRLTVQTATMLPGLRRALLLRRSSRRRPAWRMRARPPSVAHREDDGVEVRLAPARPTQLDQTAGFEFF